MGDRDVLTRHCWVSSRARARTPCRPSPTKTNPRAPTDRIRHLIATFRPSHPFPPQGCGTALNVPKLPSGGDSPAFKCVWCEAVNETTPRSRHGRVRWNLEHTFTRWGGRVLVAGVVVIALAVARAPVARFAPVVYPESPAARLAIAAVTLALLFNVFFNYYHAVVAEPGSVAHLPTPVNPRPFDDEAWESESESAGLRGTRNPNHAPDEGAAEVTRGVFAGCRLCVPCGRAKPRGAHHCRTCRKCVGGMDHHCPFIGNCVGDGNTRHFVLFCLYVAVGCGWSVAWAAACARADADGYRAFHDALFDYDAYGKRALTIAGERGGSMDDLAKVNGASAFLKALFAWTYATLKAAKMNVRAAFEQSPEWVNAWAFVCTIGGVICVATAGLFASTLNAVASGETYVEALKSRSSRSGGGGGGAGRGAGAGMASVGDDDGGELRDVGRGRGVRGGGDDGGDDTCARGCTAAFRCLSGYCPFVTEFCGCCFWFCVPSEFGPAPWSKIGMFHLRQVFGSGHPAFWAMPRASPPQGARGSSQLKKE